MDKVFRINCDSINSQTINIFYTNANDLKNKIAELSIVSSDKNCDILCITETFFNKDILDAEISIPNFKIFRADRETGKGGGSCVYVHNRVSASIVNNFSVPDCIAVKLSCSTFDLILIVVYRSPSLNYDDNVLMINCLNDTVQKFSTDNEIIIVGDYNLPDLSWDHGVINCPIDTCNKKYVIQKMFLDFFVKNNFQWALGDNFITRRRTVLNTLQESTLDNILLSDKNMLKSVQSIGPLGRSDHISLLFSLNTTNNPEYISLEKVNWGRFKHNDIISYAKEINWGYSTSTDKLTAEDMWKELSFKLKNISDKAPIITTNVTRDGYIKTKSPWERSGLQKSRKAKERSWANFENFPTANNLNVALSNQREFEKKLTKSMVSYENKITTNLKRNPKQFYSYMNSKRKLRATLSGIKGSDGKVLSEAKDIANELGKFFESTFIAEPPGEPPKPKSESNNQIPDLIFTVEQVKDHLAKLNISKSQGPDYMHPKLLKSLSNTDDFITAITELFQKCYDSSTLPEVWKTALITAIHKKGDKSEACNYRPISLTCILSKIFEKILRNHILAHVGQYIVNQQHGFLPGKSCISNLLECMDFVYEILNENDTADILYLDFQKAFDTVPHKRLLKKLEAYGISGKTLIIVKDFLSDRTFKVKVGSVLSQEFWVSSGVPQGTVLGPLLFLIYINDLPDGIKSFVSLFADDLKIVTRSSNHSIAQQDLDKLSEWEKTWLLTFNVNDNKCKVLHIGKTNPCTDYNLNGCKLPQVYSEKDLGLNTTDSLNWSTHIQKSINKAKSVIGWISRNLISREKEVMLNVYKSFVRPHLEYAVQVWNLPATHGNWKIIKDIESVQRSMTRMIDNIGLLPYSDRLDAMGLTTLLERRTRGDLIETFKIVTGKVNYGNNIFRVSRSGDKLLKDGKCEQFLPNRVANYWNKIPSYVKDAPSVDTFKARLEAHKSDHLRRNVSVGHYWELSEILISKINNSNHSTYAEFMLANPRIAKMKNINVNVY